MIPPIYLIVLLSVFVFYCIVKMFRKGDDVQAFFFFFLYLYSIFAQIGYVYFPELSMLMRAYFGIELFYKYWLFIFLSFVGTYFVYCFLLPKKLSSISYVIREGCHRNASFLSINVLLLIILYVYFVQNRSLFGWGGASPMGNVWFVIGFRIHTICTFILYALLRSKSKTSLVFKLLFIVDFIFFLQVTFAAGVRSAIVSFFMSILFFELFPFFYSLKYRKKKILRFLGLSVCLVIALSALLNIRAQETVSITSLVKSGEQENDQSFYEKILMQDYYAPSHTLFVSMRYEYVDFWETMKSNFANSLVKMNYPYLTEKIVAIVNGTQERGVGWAYHLFVEGYNAWGMLGFIYNAFILNLGILLWSFFYNSNNLFFNRIMLSFVASLIIGATRGQSCAFIQSSWMFLIPAIFLLVLATNSKFFLKVKKYAK